MYASGGARAAFYATPERGAPARVQVWPDPKVADLYAERLGLRPSCAWRGGQPRVNLPVFSKSDLAPSWTSYKAPRLALHRQLLCCFRRVAALHLLGVALYAIQRHAVLAAPAIGPVLQLTSAELGAWPLFGAPAASRHARAAWSEGRSEPQKRVTGGRWRRIVLDHVLAENVVLPFRLSGAMASNSFLQPSTSPLRHSCCLLTSWCG